MDTPRIDQPQHFWRDRCKELEAAIREFLAADGHDLCHLNRDKLAAAVGMAKTYPRLPPECEFAAKCEEYRKWLYGSDGSTKEQTP